MLAKISYRKQWMLVLVVDLVLLFFVIVFGFVAASFSEWLPILFCWGSLLLFCSIPIILVAMAANNPLPDVLTITPSLPWGILGGLSLFTMYAFIPSNYSDPAGQMYDLMVCGIGFAGMGFMLGLLLGRSSLFLLTGLISPVLWNQLFGDELLVIVFTVFSLVVVAVGIFFWNKMAPVKKRDDGMLRIEDVLSHSGGKSALNFGEGVDMDEDTFYETLPNDPDRAIAWLEEMAEQENSARDQHDSFFVDTNESSGSNALFWMFIVLFLIMMGLMLVVVWGIV